MGFVVARYGEFVLLKPRFAAATLVLWLGPFVILLLGCRLSSSPPRGRTDAARPDEIAA